MIEIHKSTQMERPRWGRGRRRSRDRGGEGVDGGRETEVGKGSRERPHVPRLGRRPPGSGGVARAPPIRRRIRERTVPPAGSQPRLPGAARSGDAAQRRRTPPSVATRRPASSHAHDPDRPALARARRPRPQTSLSRPATLQGRAGCTSATTANSTAAPAGLSSPEALMGGTSLIQTCRQR
jgi:hypothetical protein